MRRFSAVAPIVFVILAYTFFGSIGTLSFPRVRWDQGFGKPAEAYYASLTEGFLRGELAMAHRPHPRLLALPDPYDHQARLDANAPYLWDASYFNGRYYLYFSPLPALLFYAPFRLVVGMYPNDQLAGTLFAVWAFAMAVAFVRRALAGRSVQVPLPVWIVTLGLGGIVPFVLPHCRTYEVAILCGAAMTSTWAYTLLRFGETRSPRMLIASSIWLTLAIVARPNLGVLLLVLAAAFALFPPSGHRVRTAVIASVPLIAAGAALLFYNYARFGEAFEFGHRYQLTYMAMSGHRVCGVRNRREAVRMVTNASHYAFAAPVLAGEFPFIDLGRGRLDPAVSFASDTDQIGGLAPLAPLAIAGSLLAVMLAFQRRRKEPGIHAAILSVGAGWLALLGLSACWYVSARYALDFWFLILAGAIVALESSLGRLARSGLNMRPLNIAVIVVALASSVAGSLLGFNATSRAFRYFNPDLFHQLSRLFGSAQ